MEWGKRETLLDCVLRNLPEELETWVAVPIGDDELAEYVDQQWGYPIYMGDPDDVLARFVGCVAVIEPRPEAILRVCADRPFIVPEFVKAMFRYWEFIPGLDYLAPPVAAIPFAGEIVDTIALSAANNVLPPNDPYREHVTLAIARNQIDGWAFGVEEFPVTVDTPDDYLKLRP